MRLLMNDNIVLPKVPKSIIKPLSNEEVVAVLQYNKKSKYYLVMIAALFTGLRQSELIGLQWSDVNFISGTITISKQLIRNKITGQYEIAPPKNDEPRTLCPAGYLMEELYKAYNAVHERKRNDYVFTDENGKHFSHNSVYRYFKKVAQKAFGRPEARFHDLRHTFAVLTIQAGDDVKTLQTNMGHSSAAFTLNVYGHCMTTMQKESSRRMDEFVVNKLL